MSVAATAGLGYERVNDVALATNEGFALVSVCANGRVSFDARRDPGSVEISITAVPNNRQPCERKWAHDLSERVITTVTDSMEYDEAEGTISFVISEPTA